MSNMFTNWKAQVQSDYPTIVFPEGTDARILEAACRLSRENILKPILIGHKATIQHAAQKENICINHLTIVDPTDDPMFDQLVASFLECREGKTTVKDAHELLLDVNYFGTMLVHNKVAQGLVSGATHSTANTVRPALQIIKMKDGVSKTSGAFLMLKGDERYIFSDCAINIAPDSDDLAEIAIMSAQTAKTFGMEPRVAMLSFSTKGSAISPETQKVVQATKTVKERAPDLQVEGECQFDAAYAPEIAKKKAPGWLLDGKANVFVFPSLEAGNIGYKMVQRMAGFEAIGPILQGLKQPVNDLSRGCSAEDVYKLAIITAMQAI